MPGADDPVCYALVVPRFEPFNGVRYNPDRVDLDAVVAPPYDVIGPDERAQLEARSPYNAVHVELARDEPGHDRYLVAQRRLEQWLAEGVLGRDAEPGFYVYRMGFRDASRRPRQTSGVIGALELSPAAAGEVLPHERTMGKPKDDRLNLLRACRTNLSPIWCLSLAPGLSELCAPTTPPVARCTDDEGVHHRLWQITEPAILEAVSAVVASAPAVMADGHHRYETALAYRDERRGAGTGPGDHDLLMAYMVELSEEQLAVRPIHRLVSGLPAGFDLVEAVSEVFEPVAAPDSAVSERMADAGALALVTSSQTWLLRPRLPAPAGPDSALLEAALEALPPHDLAFHHSIDTVTAMVEKGEADAAFLLRPVTVRQIEATARAGELMPEKTTFFSPKLRTGMVFRRLAG